ncbi:MAG: DUF3570 domain-containing protein [Polyangiaceae bacterium]
MRHPRQAARRRSWLLAALAALLVLAGVRDAGAQKAGPNDGEVEALIQGVFESDYKLGPPYKDALDKLEIARQSCEGSGCSGAVRAQVYVAVGTLFVALKKTREATEQFTRALAEDPQAALMPEHTSDDARKAFEAARPPPPKAEPVAPPAKVEPEQGATKKVCKSGGRAPRGWRSPEAFCYFNHAYRAEREREWADCAAYAQASLAFEDRPQVRFTAAGCAERAGLWIEALADFEIVADSAGRFGLHDSARQARSKAQALREKMPKLVVRRPAKATDLVVNMNDEEVPLEKLDGEIWVNPGQRRIYAKGKVDGQTLEFEQVIEVAEFETATIDIRLGSKNRDPRVTECLAKARSREDLAACLGGSPTRSPTEGLNIRFGSELSAYHDSDDVDVLTPALSAQVESPTGGWGAGAVFLVDVVTAASADILATASPRWTETRYVPAINGHKKFDTVDVSAKASLSHEPDYIATSIGVGASMELLQKSVTPSIGYELSYDMSGRAGTSYDVFGRPLTRHAIDLASTFIIDKATFLTGSLTAIFEDGDSSKPYRYVPMFSPDIATLVQAGQAIDVVNLVRKSDRLLEQLPTNRQRWALSGRIAHRFDNSTIRAEERVYVDSWGLKATTTDARYLVDLDKDLRVWPHLRFHAQTGADFWKLAYVSTWNEAQGTGTVPALRTGDRELGPLWSLTAGGGSRLAFGEQRNWGLSVVADVVYTSFLDHLFILQRFGYFGAVQVEVELE